MSDALNYLLEVRKDAMGPYFKFLKEGGKHLDNKTRSLLSALTKVDAQTERGFKQYLVRALREGNQADEILDAMLVCLPTLGLSKIIWAIEIILEMDIPEFSPDNLGQEKQWQKLACINEVQQGISRIDVADRSCFINRKNEVFKVFDSRCPHQVTNIPSSGLDGTLLTCPKHHWKFDLNDGQCIENGNHPLREIQFKIEDEYIFVLI